MQVMQRGPVLISTALYVARARAAWQMLGHEALQSRADVVKVEPSPARSAREVG
jgi:hypothetical protein